MKTKTSRSSASESAIPLNRPLAAAVAAACGGGMVVSAPALAQDQLEEIVVTATKRAEGVQDIPMAISVLGQQQLEDLNITDMQDYIEMLPTVAHDHRDRVVHAECTRCDETDDDRCRRR